MPQRHAPSIVAGLGIGLLLGVGLLLVPGRGREARAVASAGPDASSTRLEARLVALEERVEGLARRVEAVETRPVALREPVVPEPAEAWSRLAERVARLEQREAGRSRRTSTPAGDAPAPASMPSSWKRFEAVRAVLRDATASDADRASAWLGLAREEAYPWTDDLIAQAVSIGLTSEDDRAREVVWIGAESAHRSELLVQPLIRALGDRVANVREEAADALSQYLDRPGVQRALLWTSQHDESETVRDEAARALRGEE